MESSRQDRRSPAFSPARGSAPIEDAIALGAGSPAAPPTSPRCGNIAAAPGLSANLEQEITSDLGVFARAGFANGNIEPDSYTDIDRTVAAGLSLKGTQWGRPDDTFALAGIVNGITQSTSISQ